MNIHITNLNNMGGTATLAQEGVTQIATKMGWKEFGIFCYQLAPDFYEELQHRLDGGFASFQDGDIMVFQYPSWIGVNYDECFIDRVKTYSRSKLIIFVEDIQQMLFNSEDWILDYELRNLNKADLLILPSPKIHSYLVGRGLRSDMPVVYQTIWEMPGYPRFDSHKNNRKLFFPGDMSRFSFVSQYNGKTPLVIFQQSKPSREDDSSFKYGGYMNPDVLRETLAEGGFGLVWAEDEHFERYYSMNQPHKIGYMLSCGIPIIARRGCAHEEFIERYGVGFCVDSLEEADAIVQNITDDEYDRLYKNVAAIRDILIEGAFTYKVLQEALIGVLTKDNEAISIDISSAEKLDSDADADAQYLEWDSAIRRHRIEWEDKNILIVEYADDKTGIDSDIYDNARSISRIICECQNIDDCIDILFNEIRYYSKDKLVLVYLGDNGKELAIRLNESGIEAIGLGEVTTNTKKNCNDCDDRYKKQIVSKVEYRKR